MAIKKDDDGAIIYSPASDRYKTNLTGVHPADSFQICDTGDQLKQLRFDLSDLPSNTNITFKLENTQGGDVVLRFPGTDATLTDSPRLVQSRTAVGSISALQAVTPIGDSEVSVAFTDTYEDASVLGIALNAADDGGQVRVLMMGELEDPSFHFPSLTPLFLGDHGTITATDPGDSGSAYRTGVAYSTGDGSIFVRITDPIKL